MLISKKLQEKYNLDHVPVADFSAARIFAEKLSAGFENPLPASEINAMGLLDEVMHILIRQYEMENADVMTRALDHLATEYGRDELDLGLARVGEHFSAPAPSLGLTMPEGYSPGGGEKQVLPPSGEGFRKGAGS